MGAVAPADAVSQVPAAHAQASAGHATAGPAPGVDPGPSTTSGARDHRACLGVPFTNPTYFCGDPRLGPRKLPNSGLFGAILADYQRLGRQTPNGFIQTWWSPTAGSYIFPPKDGFRLNPAGNPIFVDLPLTVGQKLDRFGGEGGQFLAPSGSPFSQRSLPPQSLNTIESDYPFNYHVYKVVKEFTVHAGPAAPWFGQPGNGIQYMTFGVGTDRVGTLVANGFLKRLN